MRSDCIGNTAESLGRHAQAGLTRTEVLVLIIVVLVVVGVLCPLFKVHIFHDQSLARRMVCGSNLSAVAKAILLHANDHDDELPRAGVYRVE
jgi:hypothetical protein